MWTIEKPDLGKAQGIDIRELISNCDSLDDSDELPLKQLYQEYDDQHGNVTEDQLLAISESKAKAIHDTYQKTHHNRPLAYIRSELTTDIFKCPYCSINSPETLDHYMPESQFEALAVCRMNLVPLCGRCNNLKLAKPYEKFIHCYYDNIPKEKPFLVAKIWVQGQRFVVEFGFDSTVIGDEELESRLRYQEREIRLFERIKKESVVFISTLCRDCEQNNTLSLKYWLYRRQATFENIFGLNDWRCAVIRGLLAYPDLDISQINFNKNNPIPVNRGVS